MDLINIICPSRILIDAEISSKKCLLENACRLFSPKNEQKSKLYLDAFIAREKLGSTALGHGVALPHIRTNLVQKPEAALLQLQSPVNYDAEDRRPIDLALALIVPEDKHEDHLYLLAQCSTILIQSTIRQSLRAARSIDEILSIIHKAYAHVEAV